MKYVIQHATSYCPYYQLYKISCDVFLSSKNERLRILVK